jgi:hypothetical protein
VFEVLCISCGNGLVILGYVGSVWYHIHPIIDNWRNIEYLEMLYRDSEPEQRCR